MYFPWSRGLALKARDMNLGLYHMQKWDLGSFYKVRETDLLALLRMTLQEGVDSVEAAAALAGNLLAHMDCCLDRFINSLCYIDTFRVTTSQETMVHFLPWLLWYCLFERIKLLDIIGNIFVQSNFLPAKIFINTLRDYFTKNLIENKKIDGLGIKHRLLTICI